MRVAILSDIHGNAVALEACLADLHAAGGADRIVAAGDLCMDGPRPRRVLRRLKEAGANVVRGNTDRMIALDDTSLYDDETRSSIMWQRGALGQDWVAWLGAAPMTVAIGNDPDGLLITHATPARDDEHVWPDASDEQLEAIVAGVTQRTIAFGHLHVPYVRTWRDRTFVNVASAGLPKDGDARAHYAILTQQSGGWAVRSRRVSFDVDKVEKQIRKSGMPHVDERIDVLRRHRYKQLAEHRI
ncbi:MAG TPA: metallophosphoesterase family protein [Candidatus Lustribacter sp.]|nr:metallophosphoesterase family protein [Candidatus Lustribacter sp.]